MQSVTAYLPSRIPYGLAVLMSSIGYYALYFNSGFNFADDGNYAQICYELLLGRDPNDLVIGYGILWFKVGEFLFRIFGVNYTLIKLLFFFCITVTNVLIFYTVAIATGSRMFAFLAAVLPVLVPAFPATSFYALCVMLNVAMQMRLAQNSSRLWHAALAGVALSFSFQIRPDFGYIFAVPLIVVIALVSCRSIEAKTHRCWRTFGLAAFTGFIAVQLIGFTAAFAGGYGDVFLHQFVDYPAMMAEYFVDGLHQLTATSASPGMIANDLLQRPSITDFFSDEPQLTQLALLIYLPVAVLVVFVSLNAFLILSSNHYSQRHGLAPAIVALSAAAATLPHYFFYRPDMSHIANFMPGYIVFVAVFAAQLYRYAKWRMPNGFRFAGVLALLMLTINLGAYLWAGLLSPATGSIAIAAGRTETFNAQNGVSALVTPSEKLELEFLREVIAQNSERGDPIVCLPYCPGIAFMTERRMLLGNFYVDESYLVREPGWLSEAIELTREAKPAVIIVVDWAINGTEESRFTSWATSYVAVADELSHDKAVHGTITAYML